VTGPRGDHRVRTPSFATHDRQACRALHSRTFRTPVVAISLCASRRSLSVFHFEATDRALDTLDPTAAQRARVPDMTAGLLHGLRR
jgi:hypothetical protein